MSVFVPLRRATLLIPSGPLGDPDRKHLFILLTDPAADDSGRLCVLLVSISSVKPGVPYDGTCILYAGDHPFVKHDSYVVYQKARLEEADKLLRGVKRGLLIPQEPLDGSVFARICRGFTESRMTPIKFVEFYRAAGGRG